MISQVVFDLPLEGLFDYLVPSPLENQIAVGMRIEVFLGPRKCVGIVVTLKKESSFENLKPIKAILDKNPSLDQVQMALGHTLSAYYGCSLGEALFTIVRSGVLSFPSRHGGTVGNLDSIPLTNTFRGDSQKILHIVPSGDYASILVSSIKPFTQKKERVLILVADQFMAAWVEGTLGKHFSKEDYLIGTRSLVFRSFVDIGLVIMVDEENSSFKQEQSPMYETLDVLLMRAQSEPIHIVFISATPSPELMFLVQQGKIKLHETPPANLVKVQAIDLNNYKFTPKGLLSIPIRNALEKNLAKKEKSILVLNRKGSYAFSRCTDCGFILKCDHCDSPMMYSRIQGKYLCHHCSFTMPTETNCPVCQKSSWKSVGIGVEQIQKELKNIFSQAKVVCFERSKDTELKDFDILIATQAILRFRQQLKVNTIGLIDIDNQLNRMQIRSSFQAWSLVCHLRAMAKEHVFIQTRNPDHYVIKSLVQDNPKIFYDEDLNIRRELKLSPFGHEVMISLRSKNEAAAQKMAEGLYAQLKDVVTHPPSVDTMSKKRDQYRFTILIKGENVIALMSLIKNAVAQIKRNSRVIVTFNVE